MIVFAFPTSTLHPSSDITICSNTSIGTIIVCLPMVFAESQLRFAISPFEVDPDALAFLVARTLNFHHITCYQILSLAYTPLVIHMSSPSPSARHGHHLERDSVDEDALSLDPNAGPEPPAAPPYVINHCSSFLRIKSWSKISFSLSRWKSRLANC